MKLLSIVESIVQSEFDEVEVKQKKIFGYGVQHNIYASKTNPNILYKVADYDTILTWINIFKKYPKYFPKIYRSGRIKETKTHKNLFYVEVEKLNTKDVLSDFKEMEDALIDIGYISDESLGTVDYLFRDILFDDDYGNDVTESLKKYNQKTYRLFIKWINFFHTINQIVEPIKGSMIDLHRGNFGYDSKGNIKCLDI